MAIRELSIIVIISGIVGVWFAWRARPLGQFPYRWGTWVAIHAGLVAASLLFMGISITSVQGLFAGTARFLGLGLVHLLASIGLFRRMQVGVVLVIAGEIAMTVVSPLMFAMAFVNFLYFRKRWTTMAGGVIRPVPNPSNQMSPSSGMSA